MRKKLLLQAKYRFMCSHLTRAVQADASKYQRFCNLKIWQCTDTDKSKGKKETTQFHKAISSKTMTNSVIQILLYFCRYFKNTKDLLSLKFILSCKATAVCSWHWQISYRILHGRHTYLVITVLLFIYFLNLNILR